MGQRALARHLFLSSTRRGLRGNVAHLVTDDPETRLVAVGEGATKRGP